MLDSLGRLFIYGPVFNNGVGFDATRTGVPERYDPSTGTWTALAQSINRVYSTGYAMDSSNTFMRVAGRLIAANQTGSDTATTEFYSTATNSWSAGGALPMTKNVVCGWVDSSDVFWTGGGNGIDAPTQSLLWKYVAGSWTAMTTSTVGPFGAWASQGGVPFVTLDSSGRPRFFTDMAGANRVQRYNPASDTWTALTANTAGPTRHYVYASADELYALTFISTSINASLRHYTLSTDTWTTLASFSAPGVGPLVYHAASNSLYHIMPTYFLSGTGFIRDVGIYQYDIATNTWSTTGDAVSISRHLFTEPLFDGTGYYLIQGSTGPNGNLAANAVEYFVPGVVITGRSWGTIIG